MAYLFQSIDDLKTYIGGGGNVSLRMASIEPIERITAEKHLEPWLGTPLLEQLLTEPDPAEQYLKLLPYVLKALGPLTMYEYAKVGGIQFGENGIFRVEAEYQKTAFKYQENQYSRFMLDSGYDAIEKLLKFLEENIVDYKLWEENSGYTRHHNLLLRYASDFREAYTSHLSRYTFEVLRPIIQDIETFAIKPTIGTELFVKLHEDEPSPPQQALLKVIHKATASFAIEEGLKRQWVQFSGKDIVQNERLEPQSYQKEAAPTMTPINISTQHAEDWGNRHISNIKQYLLEHIANFPEYQTFLDQQGEPPTSSTSSTLSTFPTQKKGIIRL